MKSIALVLGALLFIAFIAQESPPTSTLVASILCIVVTMWVYWRKRKRGSNPSRIRYILYSIILVVFSFLSPVFSLIFFGWGGSDPSMSISIAQRDLGIDNFQWSTSGFGNVFVGSFTVTNFSDNAYKDIVVECGTRGASGTVINSLVKTLYIYVPPHSSKKISDMNFGFIDNQSNQARCVILTAKKYIN